MDDVLRRLGSLEKDVSVIKTDVAGVVVQLPNLATKAEIGPIAAQLPNLATKAEVAQIAAQLPFMATKAAISDATTSVIQWLVGTVIAVTALTFTIAKFVH